MENRQENISIGARELTREQVKMIVPTYEYILTQIEEIREQAKEAENDNEKEFNNTIGLFGQRGTGKTSTIYTLMRDLAKADNKNINIVLPIIKPDNYGEHTKILGSILGLLKKEIENIESEIEKNESSNTELSEFFYDCRFKKSNRLSLYYNELLEYYCYKEDEYRKLLTQHFSDMETYKKKYSYILNPDYEFEKKLKKFIDIFVEIKKKLIKNSNSELNEPLLFIIIDDIDLKTSKCKELVDSVMQYTCHKNVVCILSGDYEILQESVTLSLLEAEEITKTPFSIVQRNLKKAFEGNMSLAERKKYLAKEYLKKVLPPALRHNVVKWTNENIHNFSVIINEENTIYLHDKLIELLGEESLFCNKVVEEDRITGEEFEQRIYPKAAYCIFDKTPRGLINILYYLSKFNKEIFQVNNLEKKFEFVKSLIDTIIASSTDLIDDKRTFYNESLIWGADISSSKISFNSIYEHARYLISMKPSSEHEEIINKFYLLSFVKELLEKEHINIEKYDETKDIITSLIYLSSKNKIENYDIVQDINANSDFKFVNFLYNYLDNYIYKYNKKIINEEDIFKILYNILSVEITGKKTLVSWYKMKYEENTNKMNTTLEFLDKISRKKDEHKIIEHLFCDIIKELKKEFEKTKCKIESVERYKLEKSKSFNSYANERKDVYEVFLPLILNTIADIAFKRIEIDDASEKENLYSHFLGVINNEKTIIDIELAKKIIEKQYIKRAENIGKKIVEEIQNTAMIEDHKGFPLPCKDDNINYYVNISKVINEFNNFKEYARGCSENSLVHELVAKIDKNELFEKGYFISLNNYIFLIEAIYYIGYKGWSYVGVLECRNIRELILKNSILYKVETNSDVNEYGIATADKNPIYKSIFSPNDQRIILVYKEYCEKYYKEKLDAENLEDKKKKMIKLLGESYKEVQNDITSQLSVIGIDAESYYSEIENGEE